MAERSGHDGAAVVRSLAGWLAGLTFVDRPTDEVTPLIIGSVTAWAVDQGWRVYPRAPAVLPLPPPYGHRRSVLDIACARPSGPPVVVEVDRGDRQRSVDKLLAEAGAGRIAVWVRWGTGGFVPPPTPVHMVTCEVTTRRAATGSGRVHTRLPHRDRPAPQHSAGPPPAAAAPQPPLFPGD